MNASPDQKIPPQALVWHFQNLPSASAETLDQPGPPKGGTGIVQTETDRNMLSKRETELLKFIGRYMRESGGVSPTLIEIAHGLSLSSKGWIHIVVQRLEMKGYLRRLHHRQRAIELTTYFAFDDVTKELKPMPNLEAAVADRAA